MRGKTARKTRFHAWVQLRAQGMDRLAIQEELGISRSEYYRLKAEHDEAKRKSMKGEACSLIC